MKFKPMYLKCTILLWWNKIDEFDANESKIVDESMKIHLKLKKGLHLREITSLVGAKFSAYKN